MSAFAGAPKDGARAEAYLAALASEASGRASCTNDMSQPRASSGSVKTRNGLGPTRCFNSTAIDVQRPVDHHGDGTGTAPDPVLEQGPGHRLEVVTIEVEIADRHIDELGM